MKKRVISLMLCAALFLALVPAVSFAEGPVSISSVDISGFIEPQVGVAGFTDTSVLSVPEGALYKVNSVSWLEVINGYELYSVTGALQAGHVYRCNIE